MECVALKGSKSPVIESDHLSRTVWNNSFYYNSSFHSLYSIKTVRLILEIKALDSVILCHFKIPCAVS